MKNIPIGEVLKEYGYVTEEQLQSALAYQKEHKNVRMGAALMELGFVTEKQMLEALAQRLNLKTVEIANVTIDISAVSKIPRPLAVKYNILAVQMNAQALSLITNDPLDFYALEDVRQLTGMDLEIMLCEAEPLRKAVEYYYSEVNAREAAQSANLASEDEPEAPGFSVDMEFGEGVDEEAPIIRLLNTLVQRAIATNASDVHLEPFETKTSVRMRIDGMIVDYITLQRALHLPLIARIKIMAGLDIAEHRLPQDGHFRVRLENENVNVRVSIFPTVFGEKAVLRILANAAHVMYPAHFGMNDSAYEKFAPILNHPNGIIYLTGPTGSGKTTTLYMILEALSRRQANICTVEDPVEKNLARINQTQVNTVAGLTFEAGLRALLRQDPDIIMVGETRDADTASISVRAAITGHLVFSTLHTNDAISSLVRLEDMGVERYMIASTVVGLVAQRLVRKVCPFCKKEQKVTDAESLFLGDKITSVMRGTGCPQCSGTGYHDRVAIHEIVTIDKALREMITRGASAVEMTAYVREKQQMKTLRECALELVAQGVTTPEELTKVAYYE